MDGSQVSAMNLQYKQSQMLIAAQKREAEMRRQIKELENDIFWYKRFLAEALAQGRGRVVLHSVPDEDPEFKCEQNISGEPILSLKEVRA